VDDASGPATRDYIVRGIERAETEQAELVVLRLNTPGGLDASMRDIIRKILASRVPVATWVAPPGSRAASAGTYMLYASHIAAIGQKVGVPLVQFGYLLLEPVALSSQGFELQSGGWFILNKAARNPAFDAFFGTNVEVAILRFVLHCLHAGTRLYGVQYPKLIASPRSNIHPQLVNKPQSCAACGSAEREDQGQAKYQTGFGEQSH
jgi:hypothetical protein